MSKSPVPFDHGLFLMHLHKGKEFFDQDELQKARQELEAAYNLRPHDEKVLNMLGMTYYKLEMLPEAEGMYVVLAAGNPDVYALQSNLGLIQLKLNKLAPARDALNRALELQPNNSKAHFYMGLLCEKEELWDDALYHFEQAKADKMVAKMRTRTDEARNKPELVLPFHVVEVLNVPTAEPLDANLSALDPDAAVQSSDGVEDGEITGKMRVPDLAEAMFQIHQEEVAQAEEPEIFTQETSISFESRNDDSFQPVFIEAQGPLGTPEEEIITDESSDLMTEKMKEEIKVDSEAWEKTHPSLFPEPYADREILTSPDTNFLIGSAVDEPFLLSDEIAADISTFLAQSRTEETPEEDVFYSEPMPELTVIRRPDQEPAIVTENEIAQELRIPTPEEVENAVSETPLDPPVQETSFDQEEPRDEPPAAGGSIEEHLEELADEVAAEFEQSRLEPAVGDAQEDDLEVNFAVTDGDEEQVEQGFLQPSPLTPDLEEEQLEQTQDMADTMNRTVKNPESGEEQLVVPVEIEAATPSQPEIFSAPAPAESALEESSALQQSDEITTEQEPEVAAEAQNAVPAADVYPPANLDQFSRDRLYIQPLIGSDRFLLIDPHLLEIIISDKLICRIGTISSYTGNLQFVPLVEQGAEQLPLIQVEGSGILFLADRRKEIFLISLNNEAIHVESHHLLVAQSSLRIEPQFFQAKQPTGNNFAVVKISGRGTLALTCQTKPLTVNVHEGLPANIPAQAVIAWSGNVTADVLNDDDLRKVMMTTGEDALFLRFHGTGDVVVEQGGLWGDRRTRRV